MHNPAAQYHLNASKRTGRRSSGVKVRRRVQRRRPDRGGQVDHQSAVRGQVTDWKDYEGNYTGRESLLGAKSSVAVNKVGRCLFLVGGTGGKEKYGLEKMGGMERGS